MQDYFEFKTAFQQFVRTFDGGNKNITPCGKPLSPTSAHALMALARKDSAIKSQSDLVLILRLDKSNVARLCENLEKNGWIKREKSSLDKRLYNLTLTQKGQRLAEKLEVSSNSYIESVLSSIPPTHHKILINAFLKMAEITNELKMEEKE